MNLKVLMKIVILTNEQNESEKSVDENYDINKQTK